MRITIFSLGGLLGQYVTNTALLHGAQVTAYVPDAKAIWPRKNLTVIEGSLQNRERVLEALLEADAVISVLTPMRVKHVKEEETPLADGNAMILSAMKQLGKTRFVTVGHVCIHAFGDCEDKYQRMSTKFMQIFWPCVYKDMQKMGQVLARSDLNWTLVRTCPGRDGKVKKVGQNCSISLDGSQFRLDTRERPWRNFCTRRPPISRCTVEKCPFFTERGKNGFFNFICTAASSQCSARSGDGGNYFAWKCGMDLDCADCRFLNPSEIPEMRCKNGDRADFRFDFM